jgi:uncharacterized protein (DUF302 family)
LNATLSKMEGPFGLMTFIRLELGTIASLKGTQRQCCLFLVGNPLIATEIVGHDLRGAMLVPFRVEIYRDAEAVGASLSYDLPSSSLATLGNQAIDVIGASLDAKMDKVVAALPGVIY